MKPQPACGFTLIELLVVVAVIGTLTAILLPALQAARTQAQGTRCVAQLRVIGQGLVMYQDQNRDVLVPGRLPRLDDCNWAAPIPGGRKFRPTFLAMASSNINLPTFDDPRACASETDRFGERGDRQNYASPIFACTATADWLDERNGSYGYNYQFLGNSRLSDESKPSSFKNWPVGTSDVKQPARTVAVADCMGTAASFAPDARIEYADNARDPTRLGNEGFNLDPPRVDPVNGEMAGFDDAPQHRTAVDPRHGGRAAVLWADGHADLNTTEKLGYRFNPDGGAAFDGENSLWTGNGSDEAWTPDFQP